VPKWLETGFVYQRLCLASCEPNENPNESPFCSSLAVLGHLATWQAFHCQQRDFVYAVNLGSLLPPPGRQVAEYNTRQAGTLLACLIGRLIGPGRVGWMQKWAHTGDLLWGSVKNEYWRWFFRLCQACWQLLIFLNPVVWCSVHS